MYVDNLNRMLGHFSHQWRRMHKRKEEKGLPATYICIRATEVEGFYPQTTGIA